MEMADASHIVILVGYGLVFLLGSVLNEITMYLLVFDKILRKKLASVRWLMFGESLSEFMVCFVAIPFMIASTIIGDAPPFSTVPFFCGLTDLIGNGGSDVSYWYQAAIAVTRLAAVIAPQWYRQYVKTPCANAVLFVLPWVFTYAVFGGSALAKAYYIGATPVTGACLPQQYDDTNEAALSYANYVLSDTLINVWAPMFIALGCYGVIYSYKWWNKVTRRGAAVQPLATTAQPSANKVLESIPAEKSVDHTATAAATTVAHTGGAPQLKQMHEERDKKVKLLAIACVVSIAIVFPCNILYSLNYFDSLSQNTPALANFLVLSCFITFPINPLLYLLISSDFRRAYRQLFRCA